MAVRIWWYSLIEKVADKKGKVTIRRAYCRVIDDASANPENANLISTSPTGISKNRRMGGYWPLAKDWKITGKKQ